MYLFLERKLAHRFRHSGVFSVDQPPEVSIYGIYVFDHFRQRLESSDTT